MVIEQVRMVLGRGAMEVLARDKSGKLRRFSYTWRERDMPEVPCPPETWASSVGAEMNYTDSLGPGGIEAFQDALRRS